MTELEKEARDFICKKFSVTQGELENKNKDSDFINVIQNYIDLYIAGAKAHSNEWHYPSKGEMPIDEKTILIYLEEGFVLGWYKFGFWYSNDGEIEEDVIAWKEIVLPKENE